MDPISDALEEFRESQTEEVYNLAGVYRAIIVDINDPLHLRRVRIRIPRFHDSDMADELCPWALPNVEFGSKGSGQWDTLCKGDIVFVSFEEGSGYDPVLIGSTDPTMLNFFPLESNYHDFKVLTRDIDIGKRRDKEVSKRYKEFFYLNMADYMPKDRRPMSLGWKDRYGSFLLSSSVGFFPTEHRDPPIDDYKNTALASVKVSTAPKVNQPDVKFTALVSKYGNYIFLGDQGYHWKKKSENDIKNEQQELLNDGITEDPDDPDKGKDDGKGEFSGDFWDDHDFETARSVYLMKLFNEDDSDNKPDSPKTPPLGNLETHDQRRIEFRTRYGHLIQLRDVGWNKTRKDEYLDDPREITQDSPDVELWVKLKTKGGHLIEMIDTGHNLETDPVISLPLRKENPKTIDGEKNFGNDARMIRFVTRGFSANGSGSKIILDDRINVNGASSNYNMGILIKTSRPKKETGKQSELPRGFGIELNDRHNHLQIYSPEDQAIEFDDDKKSLTISSGLPESQSKIYKGKTDNEFNDQKIKWQKSFHLRLNSLEDKRYIKLKGPDNDGIEIKNKEGEKWLDIRENDERGAFFSEEDQITVLRGKIDGQNVKYFALDDKQKTIIIYSDDKLQIYSKGKIQFYSEDNIELKSEKSIILTGLETTLEISRDINSNGKIKGKGDPSSGGKVSGQATKPSFTKPKLKPDAYEDLK